MTAPTTIQVNGAPRPLPATATLAALLAELGVQTPLVAVELNGRIVPRGSHRDTPLRAGDVVEVVTLVGGG